MSSPEDRQLAELKAETEICFEHGTALSLYWVPSVLRLIERVERLDNERCAEGEGVIDGRKVRIGPADEWDEPDSDGWPPTTRHDITDEDGEPLYRATPITEPEG